MAFHADVPIESEPEPADTVEESEYQPQGTYRPAEGPMIDYAPGYEEHQQGQFAEEKCPHYASQSGVESQERQSRLQGTRRADILAEPGLTETCSIHHEDGKYYHKKEQKDIPSVGKRPPEGQLAHLYQLVKYVLQQAERTEPCTRCPAHHCPYHSQASNDIEARDGFAKLEIHFEGRQSVLKCAQRAGRNGSRTRITIQARETDLLRGPGIDRIRRGYPETAVRNESRHELDEPSEPFHQLMPMQLRQMVTPF